MATVLRPLLDDLRAEQADLLRVVQDADLDLPTPAAGWSVRDAVAHLMGTDVEAARAAGDPQGFVNGLGRIGLDVEGFLTGQLVERRSLSTEQLLADWQSGLEQLLLEVAAVPAGTKIPWYGPPMSPASFVTARLMEYWAHGQDVADAVGVRRAPTDRLRHIAHLGVRTRGFTYVNRGLEPSPEPVEIVLTAPGGGVWTLGDSGAADRVEGSAEDFCLLVTQRRHRRDVDLVATGPVADAWLDVAQCFAGPPGPGRPPLEDA